jgi:threonine/homoserine/homoserine lactone efflux protein
MELSLFAQGMIVGLTLAAPVGPIALICIQRALTGGRWHGIASGLGVATADTFYASITVFWITLLSGFLLQWQWLFRLTGGLVLVGVGLWIFRVIPPEVTDTSGSETYAKDYLSMIALTLANLLTILFFIAILPGFGVVFSGGTFMPAVIFVVGVFVGEACWWIVLCGILGSLHLTLTRARLTLINRLAGLVIVLFGIALVLSMFIR